jgi:hypothetical protein
MTNRELQLKSFALRCPLAGGYSKPLKFEKFRNYGEFAIIKNQADEVPPVLIPSNSTGLEMRSANIANN